MTLKAENLQLREQMNCIEQQLEWLIQNGETYQPSGIVDMLRRVKDNYLPAPPAKRKRDWADRAAMRLWHDLMGRKGLKEEGVKVASEVRYELLEEWARIIRDAKAGNHA
jgi:hypothetical protein